MLRSERLANRQKQKPLGVAANGSGKDPEAGREGVCLGPRARVPARTAGIHRLAGRARTSRVKDKVDRTALAARGHPAFRRSAI